jgi:hypothetical protein
MGERRYWVSQDDQVSGPFTREQIRAQRKAGRITGHELLRREGTDNWRPIELAMSRWRHRDHGGRILKWIVMIHVMLGLVSVMVWFGWKLWQRFGPALQEAF